MLFVHGQPSHRITECLLLVAYQFLSTNPNFRKPRNESSKETNQKGEKNDQNEEKKKCPAEKVASVRREERLTCSLIHPLTPSLSPERFERRAASRAQSFCVTDAYAVASLISIPTWDTNGCLLGWAFEAICLHGTIVWFWFVYVVNARPTHKEEKQKKIQSFSSWRRKRDGQQLLSEIHVWSALDTTNCLDKQSVFLLCLIRLFIYLFIFWSFSFLFVFFCCLPDGKRRKELKTIGWTCIPACRLTRDTREKWWQQQHRKGHLDKVKRLGGRKNKSWALMKWLREVRQFR